MQYPNHSSIISYSDNFPQFLAGISYPVALIPPAVFEIFREAPSSKRLFSAFRALGFAEARSLYPGISALDRDLRAEASGSSSRTVAFTGCPGLSRTKKLPENAYFSDALPPAERAAREAKREHPDATVFFISPCSARARGLIEAGEIEYAVRFDSLYNALYEAFMAAENSGMSADAAVPGHSAPKPYLEVLACSGGCSRGDWSRI